MPCFAPFIGIGEAAMAVMGSGWAIAVCIIFCVIVVGIDVEIVSGLATDRETNSQEVYDVYSATTVMTSHYRPSFSPNLAWLALLLERRHGHPRYFRSKLQIRGNTCADCIAGCFCSCCAVAQMRTHVKRCEVNPNVDTLLPYRDV